MKLAANLLITGLTVLASILLLGELASILAIVTDTERLYQDARALTGLFCHQLPSRCPWFDGRPTVLCFRCVGIYGGFIAGPVLLRIRRSLSLAEMTFLGVVTVGPSILEVLVDRRIAPGVAAFLRWATGLSFGLGFYGMASVLRYKRNNEQAMGGAAA